MSDDETFEASGAEASETYPKQCSALRKNEYVVIKHCPCKIVEMSTSKTGKHGHAKVHLVGIDAFSGKKYEDICPSTHSMNVPNISRKEYQVVDVTEEGFISMMHESTGELREDLKMDTTLPAYEGLSVKEAQEFISQDGPGETQILVAKIFKAMGQEKVMSVSITTRK